MKISPDVVAAFAMLAQKKIILTDISITSEGAFTLHGTLQEAPKDACGETKKPEPEGFDLETFKLAAIDLSGFSDDEVKKVFVGLIIASQNDLQEAFDFLRRHRPNLLPELNERVLRKTRERLIKDRQKDVSQE